MSQTKKFTFSLSRAMKVSERLIREADKSSTEAIRLIIPVSISLPEQDGQIYRQAEQLNSALSKAAAYEAAVADIRVAIAAKNDKIGIHSLLTTHKLLVRQRARLESILSSLDSGRHRGAVDLDQAIAILNRTRDSEGLDSVSVNVAPDTLRDEIKAKVGALNARIDALVDQQNDLNTKAKIEVKLDVELAASVGLE